MGSSIIFSSIMPALPGISIFCAAGGGGVGCCAHRVTAPTKETRRAGIVLLTFLEGLLFFSAELLLRLDRERDEHMAPLRHDASRRYLTVSYTHLRAHETRHDLVCRL